MQLADLRFAPHREASRSQGFSMRPHLMIVAIMACVVTSACAKRVPGPANVAPGTPRVSWVIMSGDSDNPDQNFVCQSEPRSDCVVPLSRPEAQVFSDVHVYYHGAGAATKYVGSMQIGFFRGSAESHNIQTSITVQKTDSISNQSVTGIVTDTPGNYAIAFSLVATSTDTGKSVPIRDQVPVVVK
jgi:hypothetical protein